MKNARFLALMLLVLSAEVFAQDNVLKKVGVDVLTYFYAVVGVIGVMALAIFGLNMKFHFIPNPMKHFVTTMGALILIYAAPSVVIFFRDKLFSGFGGL